ncbi:MAG TPA: 5-formyltetrahydrofolate cyclo-ligase [Steroidobacteraceae bacterium]
MVQPSPDLRATRRRLRKLRASLPGDERRMAERAIVRHLNALRVFRPGARVAVYLAMPGEVNLQAGLASAARAGTLLYAPRIISRRRLAMNFLPLEAGQATATNFFGIVEPMSGPSRRLGPLEFDTIVVPLLGFDRRGVRLGMGAGYYDRALRRRLDPSRAFRRPRLVGVAYACQELPSIDAAPWDVPLDYVVTESEVIRCRSLPS